MAADEQPAISARVTNENPYAANFSMRAIVSGSIGMRSERQRVPIEPGETETVSWPLSAEDAVYRNFILAAISPWPSPR